MGAGSPGEDDAYGIEVMHREIATIPDVIAGSLADPGGHVQELAGWLAGRGIEHLYLTGCGDSAFAGVAASLAFRRHSRLRVHPVHALDLARYLVRYLPPASAVLAISFSGKVGRTTEAARQAAAFGHPVIALTGNRDGQLADAQDVRRPLGDPDATAGIECVEHKMKQDLGMFAGQRVITKDWIRATCMFARYHYWIDLMPIPPLDPETGRKRAT